MNTATTKPISLSSNGSDVLPPWQDNELAWSFDPTKDRIVGGTLPPVSPPDEPSGQKAPSTVGPQKISAPHAPIQTVSAQRFGSRRLEAVSSWEGVVERVTGDGFVARLVRVTPQAGRTGDFELTEFGFDELAYAADMQLVEPGAVFYWTLGRSWNAAGTLTNVSLVRFRRIPSPNALSRQRAEGEARDLLHKLGEPDGPDSSGTR